MRIFRRKQRREAMLWVQKLNAIIALEGLASATLKSEDMERWSDEKMALDVKALADFLFFEVAS